MRKRKIFGIVAALLLLLSSTIIGVACDSESEDFSVELPRYAVPSTNPEFSSKIKDSGQTNVKVYKVKNVKLNENAVVELGEKLALHGDVGQTSGGDQYFMAERFDDVVIQLSVWVASGAIEYQELKSTMPLSPFPLNMPSKEEAALIADEFLRQAGLISSDISGVEINEGSSVQMGDSDTGEILQEAVIQWLVSYDRTIGGIQVAGPGEQLEVRIGDDSIIDRVFKCWRDVVEYKEVSVITPQEAYEKVASGQGSFNTAASAKKVVVEEAELVYWMESVDQEQKYVVPIYKFTGKSLDDNGKEIGDFEGWCEALK